MRPAASFLLLVVAAACGGDADPGGRQTISLQVEGEQEEMAVYEALVKGFEDENPSIDVSLVPVSGGDEHLQKLTTSFAAGEPPELFLVNYRDYSQFVARGAIEPIGDHLDEAGLDPGDYFEPPIEAFTLDDKLQCFPQNISSAVVYLNRTLFERAGVDPPVGSWTWQEMRDLSAALTDGRIRGIGIEPRIIRLAPFVWSNGGEIVDDPDAPTRFTLDTPEALEALDFLSGLARDGLMPTEQEIASQDLETRFTTGKLAMLISSRRDTPVFREVSGLDWDVAPLPTAKEPAGILHSDAYCMSRGIDDLDAAVRFVSFAVGERGQTITALGGRTVPSLRSIARSPAFLDPTQPPEHAEVFLDGVPYIRRTPVIPTWPEIEDVTAEILTRAFYEPELDLRAVVEDLDRQTRELFEEARIQAGLG